jgi:hypothetical protein
MMVTLQTHITRYTQLRILHNYRNISRAPKQFMMGDRFLERLMILSLKEYYFQPMYYQPQSNRPVPGKIRFAFLTNVRDVTSLT